jgi:hypothetical protein
MQTNESGFNHALDGNNCRGDDPPIKPIDNQAAPLVAVSFCDRCGFPNLELFCPRCGNRRCVSCGD